MKIITRNIIGLLLVAAAGVGIVGCGEEKRPQGPQPVIQKATKGPVELTVTASLDQASVAEPITLAIEAQAEKDVKVILGEPPKVGGKFGDFRVTSEVEDVDIPVGDAGSRLWKRTMTLESFRSGDKKIPLVKISFEDSRNPKKPIKTTLETQGFTIKIASAITGKADTKKPRDIKGAVGLIPTPDYSWLYYVGGAIAAFVLFILIMRYIVRRKIMRALNAGEWARRQLNRLESEHLPEHGKVDLFYVRLTGVVRNYIERRFGIAAPKLTTREFLDEVQQRKAFDASDRSSLQDFLSAADMVKFAHFTPGSDEVDHSMGTAREFVEHTAARNEKEARV